jgi:hypothetical protein
MLLQRLAHQIADLKQLGVRNPVEDHTPLVAGDDNSGGTQRGQMPGDRGFRLLDQSCQLADLPGAAPKVVEHLETNGMPQGLAESRLDLEDGSRTH